MNEKKYFLPYQLRWLHDDSPIKIWEKSRRIGATYVQSYEDVRDCVSRKVPAVWFSSADESAAKEYIDYCEQWAKLFNVAAKNLGYQVIDKESDIKALTIEFSNGTKICALSSNPTGFRSKGGKVVIDEFAHHKDQGKLWTAAKPCTTWGFPLRILSTHNGQGCLFYKFIEKINQGKLSKWNLHTTPIQLAVAEGLADKILKRDLTEAERAAWIDEQRENCVDEITFLQEYGCMAIDEATAYLSYDLIDNSVLENILYEDLRDIKGDLYLGMDIGRRKDLSVIWGVEKLGIALYTRIFLELAKTKFKTQKEILYGYLKHPNMRKACIDETGIGMNLAEDAQGDFGKSRVECVSFTNKAKAEMATNLKLSLEDRTFFTPKNDDIRDDFHSIRKITLASGAQRYDQESSDAIGHADRFWAAALARYASGKATGRFEVLGGRKRSSVQKYSKY